MPLRNVSGPKRAEIVQRVVPAGAGADSALALAAVGAAAGAGASVMARS